MFTYRQLSAQATLRAPTWQSKLRCSAWHTVHFSLCWATTCLVASFRVANLARPYWSAIHDLRTDTCGVAAFVAAAVSLAASEYLRLRRLQERRRPACGRCHQRCARCASRRQNGRSVVDGTGRLPIHQRGYSSHHSGDCRQRTSRRGQREGTLRILALGACMTALGSLRYLSVRNGIARGRAAIRT